MTLLGAQYVNIFWSPDIELRSSMTFSFNRLFIHLCHCLILCVLLSCSKLGNFGSGLPDEQVRSSIPNVESSPTDINESTPNIVVSCGSLQSENNYVGEIKCKLKIKQISTGSSQSCAIASDDHAYCWGNNSTGELGNNSLVSSYLPVAVDTSGVLNGLTIKSISTSFRYTCAIASDDQVYCWGHNSNGQLGNHSNINSIIPVAVDRSGVLSGKTIKKISTGAYLTCAIASDDKAYCWGANWYGQLGNGLTTNSNVPVAVDMNGALSGKTIKEIKVAPEDVACVIASDDQVYCWGSNYAGQLGNNTTIDSTVPVAVNTSGVLNGKTVLQLTLGFDHVCILASDFLPYCWGYNWGNTSGTDSSVPVAVYTAGALNGLTIEFLGTNDYDSCVVASNHQVYCWDHTKIANQPILQETGNFLVNKTIKQTSYSSSNLCFLLSDDQVYCRGANGSGELGVELINNYPTPTKITHGFLADKTIKEFGNSSSCAITSDGLGFCLGSGYLNNDTTKTYSTAVATNLTGALSGLTLKKLSNNCAIASDDLAYCWGANTYGEIGNGTTSAYGVVHLPTAVSTAGILSGKTFKEIGRSLRSNCVIASDNLAYCWGYNGDYGELGNNSTVDSNIPVAVAMTGALSGKTVKHLISPVGGGSDHMCMIASDDMLYCWGRNFYGQFGNNTQYSSSIKPTPIDTTGVLSGKTIKGASTSAYSTCVIASDDKVYCWGQGTSGQLGNNSATNSLVPVAVDTSGVLSGKVLVAVSVSGSHACVFDAEDMAYCWGSNDTGQLGNNLTTQSNIPVAVNMSGALSGKTIKQISQSCIISSDDLLYCWGASGGTGSLLDTKIPVIFPGID